MRYTVAEQLQEIYMTLPAGGTHTTSSGWRFPGPPQPVSRHRTYRLVEADSFNTTRLHVSPAQHINICSSNPSSCDSPDTLMCLSTNFAKNTQRHLTTVYFTTLKLHGPQCTHDTDAITLRNFNKQNMHLGYLCNGSYSVAPLR